MSLNFLLVSNLITNYNSLLGFPRGLYFICFSKAFSTLLIFSNKFLIIGLIIDPENISECEYVNNLMYLIENINFFLFFLLPLVVIIILYIQISRKLRDSCQEKTLNYAKCCSSIRQIHSRQSTIRMLSMQSKLFSFFESF